MFRLNSVTQSSKFEAKTAAREPSSVFSMVIKPLLLSAGAMITLFAGACLAETPKASSTQEQQTEKSTVQPAAITAEFQKTLGGKLKQAISEGGPVKAINVCSEQALTIAKAVGDKHGVLLKRVSSKPRNPADTPDSHDASVLAAFALAHHKNPSAILEQTVTLKNGNKRYYKGITMQPLCLTCHGDTLVPEVKAAIDQHYPDDKASGYKNGDFRGAFVVEYP